MRRIFLYIGLSILIVGCGFGDRSHDIADVTKQETIVLKKDPDQGSIYSLTVRGEGKLDGEADIILILNDRSHKTIRLSGNVELFWGGDWYSNQAKVKYKPISVTKGHLKLIYNI
jgi:hypothetical protein